MLAAARTNCAMRWEARRRHGTAGMDGAEDCRRVEWNRERKKG